MHPISTMALAISAFAVLGGGAYAESSMSSGDLIKEMHPSVKAESEGELQTGRSSAGGGDGPSIGDNAEEDAADATQDDDDNEEFLRAAPSAPDAAQ